MRFLLPVSVAMTLYIPGAALAQTEGPDSKNGARPAQATPPRSGPAQIDRNGVLILVRSTLLALDAANRTGNYTVLRDLGAPQFQAVNTAARLSEIFASQRAQNLDLSGVAVLDPQLTVLPEIGPNGLMRMAGFFPSVPVQVNFELIFAPVEGRWRPFGISVSVGQSAPVAPPALAGEGPAPAAGAKPAPAGAPPHAPASAPAKPGAPPPNAPPKLPAPPRTTPPPP